MLSSFPTKSSRKRYVEIGGKIKEAFDGVGAKLRSLSSAQHDDAALDAAAAGDVVGEVVPDLPTSNGETTEEATV